MGAGTRRPRAGTARTAGGGRPARRARKGGPPPHPPGAPPARPPPGPQRKRPPPPPPPPGAWVEALGAEPAGPGGGWFQPFDVIGITSQAPRTVRFNRGDQWGELRYRDDYVAFSGVQGPEASTDGGEVVFVGYGIVAPEYQW